MVKIGFIVEGDCEKIFIESDNFKNWANMQGIEICSPVVNAKGGGNLLPQIATQLFMARVRLAYLERLLL